MRKFNLIESDYRTLNLILSAELFLSLWRLIRLILEREGTSHQPAFMDSCLTIIHTCLPCLPNRWVNPCFLSPRLWLGWWWLYWRFFPHGEYGFSSKVSWCYSREWVWSSRTKLCCIASGKWNISRVSLQKFDNRYIMF